MEARGAIAIRGDGAQREILLEAWIGTLMKHGVVINEAEECKSVKRAIDGDYFIVETEKGEKREPCSYRTRRVVLAVGNRGAPMRLGAPGVGMKRKRNGHSEDRDPYGFAKPHGLKYDQNVGTRGG